LYLLSICCSLSPYSFPVFSTYQYPLSYSPFSATVSMLVCTSHHIVCMNCFDYYHKHPLNISIYHAELI
jgi:hypothetical protein